MSRVLDNPANEEIAEYRRVSRVIHAAQKGLAPLVTEYIGTHFASRSDAARTWHKQLGHAIGSTNEFLSGAMNGYYHNLIPFENPLRRHDANHRARFVALMQLCEIPFDNEHIQTICRENPKIKGIVDTLTIDPRTSHTNLVQEFYDRRD